VRQLKARQFPEDAGPLAHPVRPDRYIEINNFYTATVYEKGSELCRMLQTLLGRDGFRKAMDLYFKRHDGEAATVEDFVACMADASGRDLTQFMTWYAQAGTPELVCDLRYDARTRTAELSVEQVLPPTPGEAKKKPLHMPLRMGLLGHDGRDLPLVLADGRSVANGVLEITKRSETFRFKDVPARPVPSLLRGFSAPVNLTIDLSDSDLRFLMAHDSDHYNRWQASQDYATRVMIAAVAAIRKGDKPEKPAAFVEALGQTLDDDTLDPAYRAQFVTLPSESDVARIIGRNVDPAAIYKARRMLRRAIGQGLGAPLERLYDAMAEKGAYSPLPAQAGRRALRNACLALLAQRGTAADLQRVARHFAKAGNATDEVSALGILSEFKGPERDKAFERFHARWKGDHLMIDHWFAYQAASPLPGTLAQVKKLTKDPLFSIKNPNKVRALIGTFAAGNPVNFNRADGKGYAFVADRVLEIDRFNPQVAARMLAAFRSWKTLEPERREAAGAELKRIAATKPLSDDVFEIVSKMLD
jgi:aminopeptidase N